ncbi:hypothetical protein ACFQU2_01070 [Siccirubricoccus deserti]
MAVVPAPLFTSSAFLGAAVALVMIFRPRRGAESAPAFVGMRHGACHGMPDQCIEQRPWRYLADPIGQGQALGGDARPGVAGRERHVACIQSIND